MPSKLLSALGLSSRAKPELTVLMVCMGNICRSPIAEVVLRAKVDAAGLGRRVAVDSAGTHANHVGAAADPRAVRRAAARGYRLDGHKARQLKDVDYERADLVFAMDDANLARLEDDCPHALQRKLGLLLAQAPALGRQDVPDPYYSNEAAFDLVLDLVEPACDAVVAQLRTRLAAAR